MRPARRWVLLGVACLTLGSVPAAWLGWRSRREFSNSRPGYYLTRRNVEIVFHVADANTGNSIPQAAIEISPKGLLEDEQVGVHGKAIRLVTNDKGKSTVFRENVFS